MQHSLRLAYPSDSEAILNIYAPYIRDTAVSFETEVPSVYEFACRIEGIRKQYPYIVYLVVGKVIGYAYASKHRDRAAYDYNVETSIYVLPEHHSLGVADKLYNCLFEILNLLGYHNAYAGITIPNEKSERFHIKHGFELIGTYYKAGYKLNRWLDVAWFGKVISECCEDPQPIKSINELSESQLSNIFLSYIKENQN